MCGRQCNLDFFARAITPVTIASFVKALRDIQFPGYRRPIQTRPNRPVAGLYDVLASILMKMLNLTAISLLSLSFVNIAEAIDLPARKPGLWELTITAAAGLPATTIKQCIDAQTDAKMQNSGTAMVEKMGGKCSKNTMQRTSIGYQGEAICEFQGSKMVAKTLLTGDFQTQYSGEVTTKFDPPVGSQGGTTMKMSGKFLGPCETGMIPGDTLMPNGQKVNVEAMTAQEMPSAPPQGAKQAPAELNKKHHDILRQLEDLKINK